MQAGRRFSNCDASEVVRSRGDGPDYCDMAIFRQVLMTIKFDSRADYCTVRVTVFVAVVLPEVPVTVTV